MNAVFAKSFIDTIGVPPLRSTRFSHNTKPASTRMPPTIDPRTSALTHPDVGDSMMPNTMQNNPIDDSSTPTKSIFFARVGCVSSMITDPATRIAATTTLMRKPQRHE